MTILDDLHCIYQEVPQWAWRTDKDDVADLTPLSRPPESETPSKEPSFVTPVSVAPTPEAPKLDICELTVVLEKGGMIFKVHCTILMGS